MNVADYVRDTLLGCSLLADAVDMQLDFVDNIGDSYSLDTMPTPQIIQQYMDGGAKMRFSFALTSVRSTFSDDDRADNANRFEQLATWMRITTRRRQLPAMSDGMQAMQLNPTGSAYLAARDPDGAQGNYQMGGELIYTVRGL